MATVTGTGSSILKDTATAATEAARAALRTLNGNDPSFGLVFSGPRHDLGTALSSVKALTNGADFLGCSTAGEITQLGLTHEGVTVFLVSSDKLTHEVTFSTGMKDEALRVAEELAAGFDTTKKAAFRQRRVHSATVLLTDGLSGTGEKALQELLEQTDLFQQVVGGAAGDEGHFDATYVGAGERASTDAAAALHLFGSQEWGIGVGHGLRPNSERMRVTRAVGNVVYEIDGEPAFDVYRRHAKGRGVVLTEENAGPYLIGNELGIYSFEEVKRARAPLAVAEDGALSCAAEIPQGASVCILDGEPDSMVEAVRRAAEEARENLKGNRAAGILLFDCVCRGMILKDEFRREIDTVRSVFGDVPVAGFLTYGEIARYAGKLEGWHNTTAVVFAIPE